MWFKALVAVACVAVIGFVGIAGWDRYAAHQQAQERAKFESFCELQFDVADTVRSQGREPAPHVQQGMAQCTAAGYRNGR